MTILDDNVMIELSDADMKKAVEHWLNDHLLQKPCTVTDLNYPAGTRHSIQIRFTKSFEPEPVIEDPVHGIKLSRQLNDQAES